MPTDTKSPAPENVLISFVGYDRDDWKACLEDLKHVKNIRDGLPEAERARPLGRADVWRPCVSLVSQPSLRFAELHLLHDGTAAHAHIIRDLKEDILKAAPEIRLVEHTETFLRKNDPKAGPWDMKTVYAYLYKLFQDDAFQDPDKRYFVNCSCGTAIMRSSLFLLAFQGRIRADCIRAYGWRDVGKHDCFTPVGSYVIDSPDEFSGVYAEIRKSESPKRRRALNADIYTKSKPLLDTLDEIGKIAQRTREPILLTGPTGSGKTYIARNIATVIKKLPDCKFIQRNCAMFAGDEGIAKSDLFGHSKGGFSGATTEKVGALALADGGVLFLDEIGDLPRSVQAMLLTALEDAAGKGFPRLGDNKLIQSRFQLICGTNHDLWLDVQNKMFRQDLLERINLWHFEIPGLKDRREDVISYANGALKDFNDKYGIRLVFGKAAQDRLQEYGLDPSTSWSGNVRELRAMVYRMATLATGSAITRADVEREIIRNNQLRRVDAFEIGDHHTKAKRRNRRYASTLMCKCANVQAGSCHW